MVIWVRTGFIYEDADAAHESIKTFSPDILMILDALLTMRKFSTKYGHFIGHLSSAKQLISWDLNKKQETQDKPNYNFYNQPKMLPFHPSLITQTDQMCWKTHSYSKNNLKSHRDILKS